MNVSVPAGKYVLAVSGGIDSMVLLDLLTKKPNLELIAAHFNHNIRQNSVIDEELVKQAAAQYQLKFEAGRANLGRKASEEAARTARYAFLRHIQAKYSATAIITAHHQDDAIETALINLIRGTNRNGLSAIINNKQVLRPLLGIPKPKILVYARSHKLNWLEDPTNKGEDYLRNYLRLKIIPRLTNTQRRSLVSNIDKVAKTNMKIDSHIATISQKIGIKTIDRQLFSALPTNIGKEVLAYRLRRAETVDFDSKTIDRLNIAIRTSRADSRQPVKQMLLLNIGKKSVSFTNTLS